MYAIRANHLRDGYIIRYVKLETTVAQSELILVCHPVFQFDDLPRFGLDFLLGGIYKLQWRPAFCGKYLSSWGRHGDDTLLAAAASQFYFPPFPLNIYF